MSQHTTQGSEAGEGPEMTPTRWRVLLLLVVLAGLAGAGFMALMQLGEARDAEAPEEERGAEAPPVAPDFEAPTEGEAAARIAAHIEGLEDIAVAELDAAVEETAQAARRRGVRIDAAWLEARRGPQLEALIEARLLDASIAEAGITVAPEVVEARLVEEIRERFGDRAGFERFLRASGRSEAKIRERLVRELSLRALLADASGELTPTEAEMRAVYEENRRAFVDKERVVLDLVTAPVARPATPETVSRAATRAEAVKRALERGAAAEEAAEGEGVRLSYGARAVYRGGLESRLEAQVFAASPGSVVGPVRTRLGFRVVRVLEHHAEGVRPFEAVRESVRVVAERELLSRRREATLRELLEAHPVERRDGEWQRVGARRLRALRGTGLLPGDP